MEQHVLIVVEGPEKGRRYPLEGLICTLGRAADNAIVLDSPRISRHHAQIRLLPGEAVIEDLGSTNGTWVNAQRLMGPHTLTPGDLIRLADYVTLEYVLEDSGATETVLAGVPEGTQVMAGEPFEPVSPPEFEASQPYQPAPEIAPYASEPVEPAATPGMAAPGMAAPEVVTPEPPSPPKERPSWLYIVVGVLAVLICLCLALAVYLWFAPASFWEKVFQLLGIPLPSGLLLDSHLWFA